MNEAREVIIETVKARETLSDEIERYQTTFGVRTLEMAHRFRMIEENLHNANKPHLFFQLIKGFFEVISSDDPSMFHYDIAKKVLKGNKEQLLEDEHAVDLLARELVKACNEINRRLTLAPEIKKLIDSTEQKIREELGDSSSFRIAEFPDSDELFENQFFIGNISVWDKAFLDFVATCGKTGKKEAKELAQKFRKKTHQWDVAFWFRSPDLRERIHFFHSHAFLGLAAILWDFSVEKKVQFASQNVPALTTNIHIEIGKLLSPRTKFIESEKQLQIINGEEALATFNIPTIPVKLFPSVLKGVPKLNSVYGHRLFRYEVQEPFKRMIRGEADFRVLKFEGGKSQLAEILGFKGKKAVTVIGELLCAQAYLNFTHNSLSGNLIQLSKCLSPITQREEGLLITVGTMLLPYHTFKASENGENGLLIPFLLKDPPLIGSTRYNGFLYSLQMDVMAEFSRCSIDLYKSNCIKISKDRWKELCHKNNIPPSLGDQVHDRWLNDGNDGPRFLKKVDIEHYTLGAEYAKELGFLKEQGKIRAEASVRGKQSQSRKSRFFKK